MSQSSSPAKSSEMRTSLDRNIKININNKYLPADFFTPSVSQATSRSRRDSYQSPVSRRVISSMVYDQNSQKGQGDDQLTNLNHLKRRFTLIERSNEDSKVRDVQTFKNSQNSRQDKSQNIGSGTRSKLNNHLKDKGQEEHNIKEKILLQKHKIMASNEKKSNKQADYSKEKRLNLKRESNKMAEYILKMKNVINIDLDIKGPSQNELFNFSPGSNSHQLAQEDIIAKNSKRARKIMTNDQKDHSTDLQTNDSPKVMIKIRPKSQLDCRKDKVSKQRKLLNFINPEQSKVKVTTKVGKIKLKTREIAAKCNTSRKKTTEKSQQQSKQPKATDRYDENESGFIDINLGQDGMLTFYAGKKQRTKGNSHYSSDKYGFRNSLPKIGK